MQLYNYKFIVRKNDEAGERLWFSLLNYEICTFYDRNKR